MPGGPGNTVDNFDHLTDPNEPVVWLAKDPAMARLFVDIYHANSGRKSGDVYIYRVEPMAQVYPMDIGEWATAQARVVEIVEQPAHAPLVASVLQEHFEQVQDELEIRVREASPKWISISAYLAGGEVGFIQADQRVDYDGITGSEPVMVVAYISVNAGSQKYGIGTKLWEKARELAAGFGMELVHDRDRSYAAEQWIKTLPSGQKAMPKSQYDPLVSLSTGYPL